MSDDQQAVTPPPSTVAVPTTFHQLSQEQFQAAAQPSYPTQLRAFLVGPLVAGLATWNGQTVPPDAAWRDTWIGSWPLDALLTTWAALLAHCMREWS